MSTTTTDHPDKPKAKRPPISPELLNIVDTAAMFGITPHTIREWLKLGLMPSPVRVNERFVRFRRREMLAWIAASCPVRRDWAWHDTVLPTLQEVLKQTRNELAGLTQRCAEQRHESDAIRREIASLEKAKAITTETLRLQQASLR